MQFSPLATPSLRFRSMMLLAALSCVTPAHADAQEASESVVLKPVDVTAMTTVTTGDVEINEYTGYHTRIAGPNVSHDATTLAETIAHETGIQSTQSGAEGSWSTIAIRGATAVQTAVYLDGVLLNNASNGSIDLASLSMLDITTIDIYRGETPVQLGLGGIGGAVNLQTSDSQEPTTRLLLGVGSFNSTKAQLSHQQQFGRLSLSTSVNHQQSDNDFSYRNDNGTPLNPNDDIRERRRNAQFERSGVLIKAGFEQHDTLRYDGSLQFTQRFQGVPHWRNAKATRTTFDTDSMQVQFNQRITGIKQSDWNLSTGVYATRNTEIYDDRLSQVGLGTQYTTSTIDTIGVRAYQEYIMDTGTLAINHDLRRESLSQLDQLDDNDFRTRRQQLSGAWQYSWFSEDESWLVTPALRYNVVRDNYDNAPANGNSSYDAARVAPQLGIRWQPGEAFGLTANIGRHFREPGFFELFGDRGLFTGNDGLTAEEGTNFDVGLAWQPPGKRTTFRLSAFRNARDNLIVNTFNAQGIGRAENVGAALIMGLEASTEWQLSPQLTFRANATLLSPRNEATNAASSGQTLPGVAKTTAYTALEYRRGGWRWWYGADLIRDRFYDSANLLAAPNQLIHSAGVSLQTGRTRLSLLIHNLGDDIAEDINGYPKPGRSFQLNVTYHFDRDAP